MTSKTKTQQKVEVPVRIVSGIMHADTKQFLPYPLRQSFPQLAIDDLVDHKITVRRDDKASWSGGGGEMPLVLALTVEVYLPDHADSMGRLLTRRCAELGIEPVELPARASIDDFSPEVGLLTQACENALDALYMAALRLSHWTPCGDPDGLEVPVTVPVGRSHREADTNGRVPTRAAVADSELRRLARRHLKGADLEAFNDYCCLWDSEQLRDEPRGRTPVLAPVATGSANA